VQPVGRSAKREVSNAHSGNRGDALGLRRLTRAFVSPASVTAARRKTQSRRGN